MKYTKRKHSFKKLKRASTKTKPQRMRLHCLRKNMRSSMSLICQVLKSLPDMIHGMKTERLNSGLNTVKPDLVKLMLSPQCIKVMNIAGNPLKFLTMTTMKGSIKSV